MPTFTKTARNIIQGISQQDDRLMIEGQCRDLLNIISSPVEGLVKRPSTLYRISYDFLDFNTEYKWFDVESAGDNLQFILSFTKLYILRNDVLEETITLTEEITAYLTETLTDSDTASLDNLALYYIGGRVYVVNKQVTIRTREVIVTPHATSCSIWAVGVSTNKKYEATVTVRKVSDDSVVHTATAEILVDTASNTKTSHVIDSLYTTLDGDVYISFAKSEEVIVARLNDDYSEEHYLSVITNDDASNTYLKSYSDVVPSSSDLPRLAFDGMRATVSVAEGNIDDWYLQFESEASASTSNSEKIGVRGRDILDGTKHWQYNTINTDTYEVYEIDPISYSKHTNSFEVVGIESNLYDLTWESNTRHPDLNGQPVSIGDYAYGGSASARAYIRATRRAVDILPTKGVWKEVAKAGTNAFDETSLPVIIEYSDADSAWSVGQDEWLPRRVGDEDSAPFPSFVGAQIKSLYEYAGRLIATTNDGIELSNTNDHQDWFRNTATQLLTTDPFGLTSGKKKGVLVEPITLNGELFIWGEQDQFKLVGNDVSITGSSMVGVSSYTSSLISPIVTGDVIHFVSKTDKYNILYAFAPKGNYANAYAAESISDQIATLIEGNIRQVVSSYNMNTLLVTVEEDKSKVYLYNYYYVDNKLQQSAWSVLDFGFDIENINVTDNQYNMTVKYAGKYHGVKLDLKDLVRPDYIHTDIQQELKLVNGYASPSVLTSELTLVDYQDYKGKVLPFEIEPDGRLYCPYLKDEASYTCILGKTFNTIYEPRLVVENAESGAIKYSSIVKLNKLGMVMGATGSFDVEVSGPGFDNSTQYNSSAVTRTIYDFNTQQRTFDIPVRARNNNDTSVKFLTDSHLPFTVVGMYYNFRTSQRGTII